MERSKINMGDLETYGRDISPSSSELRPTMRCAIFTTKDALLLVQRCIEGRLQPILRRPHDRERTELVKAGNVFVYTELDSNIKRWTDGVNWSPSRILNNFLVYRELDKAFAPGEKKKATKRPKRFSPYDRNSPSRHQQNPGNNDNEEIYVSGASRKLTRDEERMLVGSLNDSYQFKQDGLIKKTFSIQYREHVYHVVWYFSYWSYIEDKLSTPETTFPDDHIYPEFLKDQNFRVQINADGVEMTGSTRDRINQDSLSRSPPIDHDVYHVHARYANGTAYPGYQFATPNYMPYPHTRPQHEQHYQTSNVHYPDNTQTSYSPQQPRSYAGPTAPYAPQANTDYTDSLSSQSPMPTITSPHRIAYGNVAPGFYYPQPTIENASVHQQNRMRSGISSTAAMQQLTARVEDPTVAYANSGAHANFTHHAANTEYDTQSYQVSEPQVDNTGLMTSRSRDDRNGSTGNNIPGQLHRGHVSPGQNQINHAYPTSHYYTPE